MAVESCEPERLCTGIVGGVFVRVVERKRECVRIGASGAEMSGDKAGGSCEGGVRGRLSEVEINGRVS